MEPDEYCRTRDWLYAECREAYKTLLAAFTAERMARITEGVTWTESIGGNEVQYEFTVLSSGIKIEKVMLSATLSRRDGEYETLHPLKVIISDEDV